LIRNCINLDTLWEYFLNFFSLPPLYSESYHNKIKREDFDEIKRAFAHLFTNMNEALEEYWSDSVSLALNFNTALAREDIDCDHNWNLFRTYKTRNNYYLCSKCGTSAASPVKYESDGLG
jgi:hypothetical protein